MSMLIKQKIIENYGRLKFDLQVIGDGARWIKGISKLINASYILDKFHLEKLPFIAFGYGKYNTKNNKMFQNHTINGVTFYIKII